MLPTPRKPRLRGRIHQVAFFVSLPAGASLIALAQTPASRIVTAIYAASLTLLYGASALLHRMDWAPRLLARMRKLDYSAIFLLIAGTNTALAFLALEGAWRVVLLSVVWAGAVAGIALKTFRVDGFQITAPVLYLALGWVGVVAAPVYLTVLGMLKTTLLALGGVLYTVGFVVLTRRRPDPVPDVYGYYEVWHTFVVAASLCHYTVVLLLLLG